MKQKISKVLVYIVLVIGAFIVLFPFFWMIMTSLKTLPETMQVPPKILPNEFMWNNYQKASEMAPFGRYFLNSIFVSSMSTIFVLITTILAAFSFSKYEFKGKNFIFTVLLATLMIPGDVLLVTNFATINALGLYDTSIAMFLPFIGSIFYIFLVRQFFISIPNELYLTSKVDGCSDFRYLMKILIPVSKPILITVGLLNTIVSWNSFMWPLLVTSSVETRTLPIGLLQFTTDAGTQYNLLMAASAMIILPMVILFLVSRKYIVSGLTAGAIKG